MPRPLLEGEVASLLMSNDITTAGNITGEVVSDVLGEEFVADLSSTTLLIWCDITRIKSMTWKDNPVPEDMVTRPQIEHRENDLLLECAAFTETAPLVIVFEDTSHAPEPDIIVKVYIDGDGKFAGEISTSRPLEIGLS